MKNFFKYILGIVLLFFTIAFTIQYFSDRGLRNLKNTQINDWENILEGKINSDIIINGSSRGFFCYNPIIIGNQVKLSCFNLSFNAGRSNLQQYKFDIYIKKNKKPKVVIQNIDFAYFMENKEIPDEWQFYPFVYNRDIDYLISKFDTKFNWFKVLPMLKYNQNAKLLKEGIMANFSNSVRENAKTLNGFCPQNRVFKVDTHNLKKFESHEAKLNIKN